MVKKIIAIVLIILLVTLGGIFIGKHFLSNTTKGKNNTKENDNNSYNSKKSTFTIVDPLNHIINISDDEIYTKLVELDYLYKESMELSEKASKISENEIDSLKVTDIQKQAFKRAISYLKSSGFSYKKLVGQLEYEKFSHEDSLFVVDNCKVDWNEQALIYAKATLASGGISEEELKERLINDKFTSEQTEYAIKNVNADYYEQAVWQACFYKYSSSNKYDREVATERLKHQGFTNEQAEFAIDTVYKKMK